MVRLLRRLMGITFIASCAGLTIVAAGALLGVTNRIVGTAMAATPEEDAAMLAAQAWVKAVTTRNVEAQMKLLPPTMFATSGDRDRARLVRVRDNEIAIIKDAKTIKFEVSPPVQTLKVGKSTALVIPYTMISSTTEATIQTNSSLIALALDGGSPWSVFDGSGHTERTLKTIIPGYKSGLNLPLARASAIKGQ